MMNLLGNTSNQPSKVRIKNWIDIITRMERMTPSVKLEL